MKYLTLILALLISPIALAANWGEAFTQSRQHEANGQYWQATNSLAPLLDEAPEDYLLNLRLGWLSYLAADYAASVDYYQNAVKAKDESVEPRLGLLLPLLATQQWGEAETIARQILAIDPYNYYANLRLISALLEQDKLNQAENHAAQLLERYPADSQVLMALRKVFLAKKDFGGIRNIDSWLLLLGQSQE